MTQAIITAITGIITVAIIAFTVYKIVKINGKSDVYLNKNGVVVRVKSPKSVDTKAFVSYMKELICYVEEAKEQYVDDVIGIKNRFFKQSKDFAKSRIEAVKNDIIKDYEVAYMDTYSGLIHTADISESGEVIIKTTSTLPTSAQISKGQQAVKNPCGTICASGCNSGLAFFESRIQKDFKPILEEVYRIIEENHLINRADREYEEEIMAKAEQLSSYLKNMIITYPVPIDNKIAKDVIEKRCHEVKEAIADSLRRSRTLSLTKREVINVEKQKYIERRNRQVAQIINILSEDDTSAILQDVSKIDE